MSLYLMEHSDGRNQVLFDMRLLTKDLREYETNRLGVYLRMSAQQSMFVLRTLEY